MAETKQKKEEKDLDPAQTPYAGQSVSLDLAQEEKAADVLAVELLADLRETDRAEREQEYAEAEAARAEARADAAKAAAPPSPEEPEDAEEDKPKAKAAAPKSKS